MLATFDALLGQPVLLVAVLATGAAIGIGVEKFFVSIERARRKAYWAGRKIGKLAVVERGPSSTPDMAADQLRCVMQADFRTRALFNKPERRLFSCIERLLAEESPGWRAMGQVSLGEILYSPDKKAFWAINAKRVDLLLVDDQYRPLYAIEFQGTGHHRSPETAARDAAKREALRRAGIGYVEVVSGDTPTDVRTMIRKLVVRSATAIEQGLQQRNIATSVRLLS